MFKIKQVIYLLKIIFFTEKFLLVIISDTQVIRRRRMFISPEGCSFRTTTKGYGYYGPEGQRLWEERHGKSEE